MLKVIKIGGNIVDNPDKLDLFLTEFAAMPGSKILVHGGGKVATSISESIGIQTTMINGRRVTDSETIKVVTMVYAGLINKTIVNKLNTAGCPAIGLSGADGGLIISNKRSPLPVDYGYVGDPVEVNTSLIRLLMSDGYTIVVAPITAGVNGGLLNTNADTVASAIAVAMAEKVRSMPECCSGSAGQKYEEVELVYCFEKRGVLKNIDDPSSVIGRITPDDFAHLRSEGIVADGMLPKLENAFSAIDAGVSRVVICSAEAISMPGYGGTTILKG